MSTRAVAVAMPRNPMARAPRVRVTSTRKKKQREGVQIGVITSIAAAIIAALVIIITNQLLLVGAVVISSFYVLLKSKIAYGAINIIYIAALINGVMSAFGR